MFALLIARLWKPSALALAIAAALGYAALLLHQRDAARADARRLKALLAAAAASNAAMQSAVQTQNAAVAQVRAQLAAATRNAAARERAAALRAAAAMREAAAGARALEQAPIDSGCAAAVRWGNDQAAGLARW